MKLQKEKVLLMTHLTDGPLRTRWGLRTGEFGHEIKIFLPKWDYRINQNILFCSMDKATSIAIHILPGLFYYLIRWSPNLSPDNQLPNLLPLSWTEQFLYPLGIYITWQLIHFCIQFTIIEKDPTLVTSLRYLAGDAKNPCTIYGTKLAVKLGISISLKLYITIA